MDKMYCTKCKKIDDGGGKFCGDCGEPTISANPNGQLAANTTSADVKASGISKIAIVAIVLSTMAVLSVVAVIAFSLLQATEVDITPIMEELEELDEIQDIIDESEVAEEYDEEIDEEETIEEEIVEETIDLEKIQAEYKKIAGIYHDICVAGGGSYDTIQLQEILREKFAQYGGEEMFGVDGTKWDAVYYGVCDLNGDQIPELLITCVNPSKMIKDNNDYIIESVWSVHDGEVYYVADRTWGNLVVEKDGTVAVKFQDMEFDYIVTVQCQADEDGKYNQETLEYVYDSEYFDITKAEWHQY